MMIVIPLRRSHIPSKSGERCLSEKPPPTCNSNKTQEIPHDVAIATPTLEVGVDMNNVTEVITHKAIRNISSYRQKVGRSGRERGSDALAVTLSAGGQIFITTVQCGDLLMQIFQIRPKAASGNSSSFALKHTKQYSTS